jgi:hypothetical protein
MKSWKVARVEKCRCGGREKELMGRDACRGGCEKNHDEGQEDHGEELVDHDEGG